MSDMENGITLVLVGVFWVCKAYIAGKDMFEECCNIASVSTCVFGYLFEYLVEWVSEWWFEANIVNIYVIVLKWYMEC